MDLSQPKQALDPIAEAMDDLIYALDVPDLPTAVAHIRELDGLVFRHKIGLELATSVGTPQVVHVIKDAGEGIEIMLDLKLPDIPKTNARAMKAAAKLGVWGVTIMANAGPASIKAAVENADKARVIGVTVLTSLDEAACRRIYGVNPLTATLSFCEMLVEGGATHVVCSPLEVAEIMKRGFGLIPITPGIVTEKAGGKDQMRTLLPEEAIRAQSGGGHIVVGRVIGDAADRREAAKALLARMASAY